MQTQNIFRVYSTALLLIASLAAAQTQYWDTATDSGIQGGNGIWSVSDANWSSSSEGTALDPWNNGSFAYFIAPSNYTPSRVILDSSVSAGAVVFAGDSFALTITNGGQLSTASNIAPTSYIGMNTGANSQVSLIGGPGVVSRWDLGGQQLILGYNGATATNNLLLIDGQGVPGSAVMTNVGGATYGVEVGFSTLGYPVGNDNKLIITNGGALFVNPNKQNHIGYSSLRNTAIVTGTGSLFAGGGMYVVGNDGLFVVENGAMASNQYWWVRSQLNASLSGNNRVIVRSGGKVYGTISYIGMVSLNERSNSVSVIGGEGVTSVWNCYQAGAGNGAININGGTANHMLIDGAGYDGSAVVTNAGYATVGWSSAVYGTNWCDFMIVTNGGRLHVAGVLTVGAGGHSNYVAVAQGGKAHVTRILIGAGNNNMVSVADTNSLLDVGGGNLTIGNGTNTGNALTVAGYGVVTNVGMLTNNAYSSVNLYGGSIAVTGLVMQADAQLGIDVTTPGVMRVAGDAYLNGYVCPTNLLKRGRSRCTILTCAGDLYGGLLLAPLPQGYSGNITTNLLTTPKQIDLSISGPPGGISVLLSIM